ncbi:MAG: hypothetical protein BHV84_07525 [Prevotella sp. AG:487_50_53]|nr:MAG: hypothetical protein BHV84_07525 [Prevotella sp. AG:487_50_53]
MHTYIRTITFAAMLSCIASAASAQVGYQVSLLNTATGEPRANTTVNAKVEITDSQDNVIFSGTQQATSNDFGVTGKMPFFISVTVDGLLIGKSQILSVPVAEVANKMKSSFTKEFLIGTWKANSIEWTSLFQFNEDMTMVWTLSYFDGYSISDYYTYEIDGNTIWCYCLKGIDEGPHIEIIRKTDNRLFHETEGILTKL